MIRLLKKWRFRQVLAHWVDQLAATSSNEGISNYKLCSEDIQTRQQEYDSLDPLLGLDPDVLAGVTARILLQCAVDSAESLEFYYFENELRYVVNGTSYCMTPLPPPVATDLLRALLKNAAIQGLRTKGTLRLPCRSNQWTLTIERIQDKTPEVIRITGFQKCPYSTQLRMRSL